MVKKSQYKKKKLLNNLKKRGLSTVIVTLILILISLVAIGVFWVVINNLIKNSSENIGIEKLTFSASISNVYLENSSNNVSLTVTRKVGAGEVIGMKFVFYNNSNTEIVTQDVDLKELGGKNFVFHLTMNVSTLTEISIVPIFGSSNGEENVGNVADTFDVKTGKRILTPPAGSCTPTTCIALGKNCGNWNNGTCGTMSCGTCSGGQTCNATGTCVVQSTPSLNATPITCSSFFGFNCGAWESGCMSESDDTLDNCINCNGSTGDEHVDEVMINGTTFAANSMINITCVYHPYNAQSIEYMSIRYPNTSWQNLYFAPAPAEPIGAIHPVSAYFTNTSQTGEYRVRCSIKFQGTVAEECPTGNYVDNDDVRFTVV